MTSTSTPDVTAPTGPTPVRPPDSSTSPVLPAHPVIYEINTWSWLHELSRDAGRPVTLASVPGRCWDELAALGVDAVWLMGVWQRSPAGIGIALNNPELTAGFDTALPDWEPADVVGSPYCIRDYLVDDRLGGTDGLAAARAELAARGIGLILDFVPNHVAPDHPWVTDRPELFITGTQDDLNDDPQSFQQIGERVLANGRDPFFPAWPDVVQLNVFQPQLRATVIDTLRAIADQCDGVRCDMAMLTMNDVFARTWGIGPVSPRTRTTGTRSFPPSAPTDPGSCSSPRPTGTWNGRCNTRVSTSATTNGSTTGYSRARAPPSAATWPGT